MKWLRLYDEILDDPKVQMLPGEQFKFWVNLMALANRATTRGIIDLSPEQIAWKLRLDADTARVYLEELIKVGLIDEVEQGVTPHNWNTRQYKSDDTTARVTGWRNKSNVTSNKEGEIETLDVTLHETPTATLISSVNLISDSVSGKGSAEGKPQPPGQQPLPPQVQADIGLRNTLLNSARNLMTKGLTKAHEKVLIGWFNEHKRGLTAEMIQAAVDQAALYTEGDSLQYLCVVMENALSGNGKPRAKPNSNSPNLKSNVPPNGYSWERDKAGEWRPHEWNAETHSYNYGCDSLQEALDITAQKRSEYIRNRESKQGAAA